PAGRDPRRRAVGRADRRPAGADESTQVNLVVLCIALWHPRVDVEPAAFVLRGYSVHLGVEPPRAPGWIFSAGAYGFDVPQLLTPDDWDARVFGAGVFAD